MVLINFYITGPSKRLLILTTSGLSKRFITNSGSPRTNSALQFIGHRTDIQTEKVRTGIQVTTAKAPGKSRPICKGKMKTEPPASTGTTELERSIHTSNIPYSQYRASAQAQKLQ